MNLHTKFGLELKMSGKDQAKGKLKLQKSQKQHPKHSKMSGKDQANNVYPMSRTFSFLFSKYLDTKFYGIPGFIQ